jgi:glycosyltransferase involved in cell wall biosynthesis
VTDSSRSVLIASYHFPPDAAVGALRPARFGRILAELGWRVSVLTVHDEQCPVKDPGRAVGLDGIETVRVREAGSLLERIASAKTWLSTTRRHASGQERAKRIPVPSGEPLGAESLLARVKRYTLSLVAYLPDDHKKWAIVAAGRAVWMTRRRRSDWTLTSGPPASVHLVGLVVKTFRRIRWAADFRDPWLESVEERSGRLRSALGDALERWLERLVVTRADLVVTTNETFADELRRRFPDVPATRFFSVMNSIDPELLAGGEAEKYSRFTITYAGSLYYGRTPEPLFRAVHRLLASGEIKATDIRINLIGECRYSNGVETGTLVRDYGLEEIVDAPGVVPRIRALDIMRRSHLLLVLAPANHKLLVVAKLFDYLASGSRMLVIGESGPTRDLVLQGDAGVCFSTSETPALAAYLLDLIATGAYRTLRNDVRAFSRFTSTRAVARLSERLLAERPMDRVAHGR